MKQISILNNRIVRISIHVILWTSYYIYPFFYHSMIRIDALLILRSLIPLLFLIAFFYTNTYYLIPKLLGKKKIAIYVVSVFLFILLDIYIEITTQRYLNPHFFDRDVYFHYSLTSALISALMVWGISSGLKITKEWYQNEQRKKELENQNLIAELAFLKSQVNPHFLFNALNSIYALVNKGSDQTAKAVLRLSEMMRYLLYESSGESVDLSSEMHCLMHFIELQKMRWGNLVQVKFEKKGEEAGNKIAPLLLLPFVENAFKHGISTSKQSKITIQLLCEKGELHFVVTNLLVKDAHKEKKSGIGLKNVKRRLDLIYPGRYQLDIHRTSVTYQVKLHINLQAND